MINVKPHTIRSWEKKLPWINPKRNKKGDRRYEAHIVVEVGKVAWLLNEFGLTLDGIAKAHEFSYINDLMYLRLTHK